MKNRDFFILHRQFPDSKAHGANMGTTWGRQDPGGPHVGHVNHAIRDCIDSVCYIRAQGLLIKNI